MGEFDWFIELIDERELLREVIEMFGIETTHILSDEELKNAVRNECVEKLKMKFVGTFKDEYGLHNFLSDEKTKQLIDRCHQDAYLILMNRRKTFKPIEDEKYRKLAEMKKNKEGVFMRWLTKPLY